MNIIFDIGALWAFNRNKPHSPTKSQTTISVSLDPETSLTPSLSKLRHVIDDLWPLKVKFDITTLVSGSLFFEYKSNIRIDPSKYPTANLLCLFGFCSILVTSDVLFKSPSHSSFRT
jgi:hypothetical protein